MRDAVVVGGGIVGLAVARELLIRRPGWDVAVLEKEPSVGRHQTGHNSGVAHAGIYYPPGSLKATLCRRGVELLRSFCARHALMYDEVGKLVVAVEESELDGLAEIHRRALAAGVPEVTRLDAAGLTRIEPAARGLAAVHSPTTAITDFRAVAEALAADLTARGGTVHCGVEVRGVRAADLATTRGVVRARRVVLCAGLHADRLARMAGADRDPVIVPFRGEYHRLRPARTDLVRGLIYPVPDPRYPFLGVHLTRRVDGNVDVGPNAVLGLSREAYRRFAARPGDLADTLRWPGFWRLARRHWRAGAREYAGSLSVRRFAALASRYVPELTADDLVRAPAGVRAQALGRDGSLLDDFRIDTVGPVVAVRNAPSPAATSSLAIAEYVADRVLKRP